MKERKRICHLILNGTYNEGWNYQENILPKYHKRMGLDVHILATPYEFKDGKIVKSVSSRYDNEEGIHVCRLRCKFDNRVKGYFKRYPDLLRELNRINPDILFVHDCQFVDTKVIAIYLSDHKSTVCYVDNHADFSNSATNWFSKNILHKVIWRHYAKKLIPYTKRFYGVLPARVDFLVDVYEIPKEKCELLVMGADDDLVDDAIAYRNELRKQHGINDNCFLVVTGGKINRFRPETLNLVEAISKIEKERVRIIIFGEVANEFKERFDKLCKEKNVIYIGWLPSNDTNKYLAAADLVVFPGLHSVMWEQAVALGRPCIFRDIEGFHHVDIGGNSIFMKDTSTDGLKRLIESLGFQSEEYMNMNAVAMSDKRKRFLYSTIAKESLQ